MLEQFVSPKPEITGRDILEKWLEIFGRGLSVNQENAVFLATQFPGFIDVSYLMNVWEGMKHE